MASQDRGCYVEGNELDDAEIEDKDKLGNLGGMVSRRLPFLVGGFGSEARNHDRFLDRSKVRILLCDGDEKSSREVSELLCKCSYQGIVTLPQPLPFFLKFFMVRFLSEYGRNAFEVVLLFLSVSGHP